MLLRHLTPRVTAAPSSSHVKGAMLAMSGITAPRVVASSVRVARVRARHAVARGNNAVEIESRHQPSMALRVRGGGSLVATRGPPAAARNVARRGPSVVARAFNDDASSAGAIDAGSSAQSFKRKAQQLIDDNSLEISALVNVLVVASIGFGAVYEIVEVDSDISTGWTIWEILRNIPRDNLQAYQDAVFDNPLPVKAMTSGVAYTLGDFTCQLSQGKTISNVDLKRSLRSGIAGFMIHGPLCHYWLQWTEANMDFNGAWFATPAKVFADQTVWSLFLNTAYTTCIMSLQGMSPSRIKSEIDATWWNAISAGWRFWPFVHMLTFSSIIPQDFKLLFVDCVEVIWVTILSSAVNRDAEKALQVPLNAETEMPAVQLQEQLDNEFKVTVSGDQTDFSDIVEYLPTIEERIGSGSYDEGTGEGGVDCEWGNGMAKERVEKAEGAESPSR